MSNQQGVVQAMTGSPVISPVKRVIPGGKTLTQLKADRLQRAIGTWLRGCREWTECTLSFCADPSQHKCTTAKAIDLPQGTRPAWDTMGKLWLAERIYSVIEQHGKHLLAIKITKDGIFSITDSTGKFSSESSDWEPYIEFTPVRRSAF
jgi:hypothetical protein